MNFSGFDEITNSNQVVSSDLPSSAADNGASNQTDDLGNKSQIRITFGAIPDMGSIERYLCASSQEGDAYACDYKGNRNVRVSQQRYNQCLNIY